MRASGWVLALALWVVIPEGSWAQGYYGTPYGMPASLTAPSSLAVPPAPTSVTTPLPQLGAPLEKGTGEVETVPQPTAQEPALDCFAGMCDPGQRWWFQVGGLVMARDYNDELWFSCSLLNPSQRVLTTADVEADYEGGIEATLGHRLGANWWALLTYWTLEPMNEQVVVQDPTGQLGTTLDFLSLSLSGTPVTDWYDYALAHKLALRSEFHNVELNFVHNRWPVKPCSPLFFSYQVGARWFRFDEDFLYASADTATTFGTDPANEIYLDIDVSNNLIGAQVGCMLEYYFWRHLGVFVAPRVGIYSNHMTLKYRIYSGDGLSALDVRSNKGDFAALAQLDVGAAWWINPNLSLWIGYRLVAVSGVALTTDQMPLHVMDDVDLIRQIDSNGHLLLHGGFAGLTWTF